MAALTVQDIQRLLGQSPGMRRGAAMARLGRTKPSDGPLTSRQRAFLEQLADSPRNEVASVPQHPEEVGRTAQRRGRDTGDDLTAVELAWLQRLPLDPSQVTFDDAAELARL